MPTASKPNLGRKLLLFLSEAATAVRGDEISEEAVAALAGVRAETIRRFELGLHWPKDPDVLMAAYAQAAGIEDPREIYQWALDLWAVHGAPPALRGALEAESVIESRERDLRETAARERARRERADRLASLQRTRATPKRRPGG